MKTQAAPKAENKDVTAVTPLLVKEKKGVHISANESLYGVNKTDYSFGRMKVHSEERSSNVPLSIQPKLNINQPGDQYEREADAMAEKMMRISDKQNMPPPPALIQRKVHRSGQEPTPPPALHPFYIQRKLAEASDSSAQSLDMGTRPALERFLSTNLSQVKVHNNSVSHEASNIINAKAYTTGNHIYLGAEVNGMSPMQRQSLLAHEVVHTMQQQSLSDSRTQSAPVVDAPNSTHEQEADRVAHAFTQSQGKGYHSTALQMRSNMHISSVTNPVIQRLPKTWGGEWFADTYTEYNSGTGRGVDIELRFKPSHVVDAELIGLTQSIRSIHNKTPFYLNNDAFYKGRAIKSADAITTDPVTKETDEGTQIDRLKEKNNPIYGTNSLNKGEGLEKSIAAGNSQQGWHYMNSTGKIIEKDVTLSDAPKIRSVDVSKSSGQIFETTALAIKGNQTGTYYGSVQWGWRSDDKGNFAKLPLKVVSQGVPSSTFLKSAQVWNTSKDSLGNDNAALPIVDVKITTAPITGQYPADFIGPPLSIPAGTRVQIIRNPTAPGTNGQIRVVDGVFTGNILEVTPTDMTSLTDERP